METKSKKEYWKLFKPKSCSIRLKGSNKDDVCDELVNVLTSGGAVPEELAEACRQAFLEREKLASTGVGKGVAIPHVKLSGIDRVAVSLSIHPEGVDWQSPDGEPVRVFFAVVRPERAGEEHDPQRHLDMMQWIARLCQDSDFRRFAASASNRTELVDLLKENSTL